MRAMYPDTGKHVATSGMLSQRVNLQVLEVKVVLDIVFPEICRTNMAGALLSEWGFTDFGE